MSSAVIRLDFMKGTAKAELAGLLDLLKKAGDDEIRQIAELIKSYAFTLCRKETGALASSIRIERTAKGWRVRAGGYVINPKTHKIVDYAIYIEERYPFLFPAYAAVEASIVARVQDAMVRAAT